MVEVLTWRTAVALTAGVVGYVVARYCGVGFLSACLIAVGAQLSARLVTGY